MKTIRHMQWALPATLALILAATGAAYAAEGEVTFGAQWWDQSTLEPKYFNEYRDITNGPMLESFVILDKIDGGRYALFGDNALRRDQSTTLLYRAPRWTVGGRYLGIPHQFSWDTHSPFARLGPGVFTLPDTLQRRIQEDPANQATAALTNLAANSPRVPLELQTYVSKAMVKGRLAKGVQVDVRGSKRQREGTKAFSMTFSSPGGGNVVEIPEPIRQTIWQGEARLSYVHKRMALEASGGLDAFENSISTLLVDNPRRYTDDPTAGPSRGRLDLAPDNRTLRGTLRAGIDLPHNSVLNAYAGVSEIRQDDRWLPYTINTALPIDSLPGNNTQAKAVVFTQDYRLHSSPSKHVTGTLRFRRNDYNNKTPVHEFPVEVLFDTQRVAGTVESEIFGYINTTYGGDLDLTPMSRFVVGGTVEHTRRTRTLREVNKDNELAYEGRVNYRPKSMGLVLEGRFRHGDRKLDAGNLSDLADQGEQANLRRFDVADRKQDWGRAKVGFAPNDRSELSLEYEYLRNKYADRRLGGIGAITAPLDSTAQFGLLDELRRTLGAGASYELTKRVSVNGGVGYTKIYSNQRSRTSAATLSQVTDSTWMARIVDRFVYGRAGVDWQPKTERLSFGATWELEQSPSEFNLMNIRGTGRDLPTSRFRHQGVGVQGWYKLGGNTSFGSSWNWDEFRVTDWEQTNVPLVLPANGTLFMADNFRGYRAHTISVLLRRTF